MSIGPFIRCGKCGGTMEPGYALQSTLRGVPDFPGRGIVTLSPGGPGRLIDCLKCRACGHSVTVGGPAPTEPEKTAPSPAAVPPLAKPGRRARDNPKPVTTLQDRLRVGWKLRTTPVPLADLIPLLQEAADALDAAEQEVQTANEAKSRAIGARARSEIELRLIEQLLDEGPECETTALDMDYWGPVHDKLRERLQDAHDSETTIIQLGELLRGVVNALKGPPEPGTGHSTHDAPEYAAAAMCVIEQDIQRLADSDPEAAQRLARASVHRAVVQRWVPRIEQARKDRDA